jgi:bifunctional oligoribonuclease and PAP phosphatase NrnA
MKLDPSKINLVKEILGDTSKNIVLLSHLNPDGDALGSSLGLYHFLQSFHYTNLSVLLPNGFPPFLAWMPESSKIILADRDMTLAVEVLRQADVIFCLDFNDPARTGPLSDHLVAAKGEKILIDHHPEPKDFCKLVFSIVEISSTAELIYEFIDAFAGTTNAMDQTIAQCLYAGIVTDTGSFSYSCNSPRTYEIVAHFMQLGIDGEKIHRMIYDANTEDRLRLLGACLSTNLKVLNDCKTAYIFLSEADLNKYNYQEGDSEGFVNYGLSIEGINLAAIFIEREDIIKISFRSEGSLNVNILARKFFNGGGHKNASGGNSNESLSKTLDRFEKIIKELSVDDFSLLTDV